MKTKLLFLFFLMLSGGIVQGQLTPPFTVLSCNTDTANKKLYVEIMYEKPSCQDYQAQFRMKTKTQDLGLVKVDSFLNNFGTYVNVGDSVLQRPTAGGYKLRFNLPSSITLDDSAHICIVSQVIPFLCEGCGAGGSSPLFTMLDVDSCCPYSNNDVIACRLTRGHWEAWIQDPRDCQPYHIVLMPDGRWWFSRNLNFQKDLSYKTLQESANLAGTTTGEFFCPHGYNVSSANASGTTIAVSDAGGGSTYNYTKDNYAIPTASCATYGALYTWHTAMALNGRTVTGAPAVPTTEPSNVQGICPDGWFLPSYLDWNNLIVSTGLGSDAIERTQTLKGSISCAPHVSITDSICATYDNPAWPWRRKDYAGKISQPYALGHDRFGFGLLPNGFIYGHATAANRYYHHFGSRSYSWLSSETGSSGYTSYLAYTSTLSVTSLPKIYATGVRCVSAPTIMVGYPNLLSVVVPVTISNVPPRYTVDWYDALEGGNLLKANSFTYDANVSQKVYAELRPVEGDGCGALNATRWEAVVDMTRASVKSFSYTGGTQTITLEPGTYLLEVWGAKGGNGGAGYGRNGGTGGNGGYTYGTFTVANQATYTVYVGGMGNAGGNGHSSYCNTSYGYGGAGGWSGGAGGGNGSCYTSYANYHHGGSGGGGGLSLIRQGSTDLIVAGGGGGAGSGSSTSWCNSCSVGGNGGAGGGGNSAGGNGTSPSGGASYVGYGGSTSGVGTTRCGAAGKYYGGSGMAANGSCASNGSALGAGGAAYNSYSNGSWAYAAGGGGGAGFYGGGGGTRVYSGGGGGGSGFVNTSLVTNWGGSNGNRNTHGMARITRKQ